MHRGCRVDGACSGVRGNEGGGGVVCSGRRVDGERDGVHRDKERRVRCGGGRGVDEDVRKVVLEQSAPVSDTQRHTISRGQVARGAAWEVRGVQAQQAATHGGPRNPKCHESVAEEYAAERKVHTAEQQSCGHPSEAVQTSYQRADCNGRSAGRSMHRGQQGCLPASAPRERCKRERCRRRRRTWGLRGLMLGGIRIAPGAARGRRRPRLACRD